MPDGDPVRFNTVFECEIGSINKRRSKDSQITLEDETLDGKKLAMSDGETPLRPTESSQVVGLALSGGGIRSAAFCLGALQALHTHNVLEKIDYMSTVSGGGYIGCSLASGLKETAGEFPFASKLTQDETPSLQHIRDYSNYLFPNGPFDLFRNAAIYARGLVANGIMLLEFLCALALINIFLVWHPGLRIGTFVWSGVLAAIILLFVIIWGLWRSFCVGTSELGGGWARAGWFLLVLLAGVLFFELQVYILNAVHAAAETGGFFQRAVTWIKGIIVVLAPVSAAFAFLSDKIADFIKRSKEAERWTQQAWGHATSLVVYVAGAIIPLLLWVISLQLSYWGMYSPFHFSLATTQPLHHHFDYLIISGYVVAAIVCFFLTLILRPNANSLHALYRDRLSKAFLFKPRDEVPVVDGVEKPLDPVDPKLGDLSDEYSPYILVNSALNVGGSKEVNRRGRNADFFLFSHEYIGSKTTGYVRTKDMQDRAPELRLGSVMAISGAAFSSNMGASTIKPLIATLALLNIRLGYWLRNPRKLGEHAVWGAFSNYYFLAEMFGMLNEKRHSVYLSDGGHIENLGIYELLRRRCKVIIAVDAECDSSMAFGSFNVLERFALVDLGVRIDLPWLPISEMTKKAGKEIDDKGDAPKKAGPHVAIGEICYPGKRRGILVYIKSSLTGDENDYIFHYKKRYSAFPHETTLDQLFSEEQFEAYRALGFHATHRFFDRRDDFAHLDPDANPCARDDIAQLDKLFPLRTPPDRCAPRKSETFADWLAAKPAAEADDKPGSDDAASLATVAEATGKIAAAAEQTARRFARPRPRRRANPE